MLRMKNVLDFNQWMLQEGFTAGATGVSGDPKLQNAADVIGQFMNKKTGMGWKKFPFVVYHNGVPGVMFFTDKGDQAFRVGGNTGTGPGIVGSLDFLEKFWQEESTFTISSAEFPIVRLVGEFAKLVSDVKYRAEVAKVNEARVRTSNRMRKDEIAWAEKQLAAGASVQEIADELGLPYEQIVRFQERVGLGSESTPEVETNSNTLQDKVKWLEETMNDIYDISRKVAAGAFNSLFISGRAGTGKTFSVEKAMHDEGLVEGDDWVKISGAVSTIIMFKQMFLYRNKVLVFDDCDAVFNNEDGRNILKAALDTKKVRNISYMKKVGMLFDPKDFEQDPEGEYNALESGLIPNKFDFAGRVIFISNLDKKKADPDGAIRSRSILVDVNPDDATLMERMRVLLPHLEPRDMPIKDKEEIYEFMKNANDVSMRTFVKAAGFKMAGLSNWKRMASRYL